MLVYVDDIILTGNCTDTIDWIIHLLGQKFSLKNLGALHYFFGVEVIPKTNGIILSQQKYIKEIIARASMSTSKPLCTPSSVTITLTNHKQTPHGDPKLYRQIVGAL